jgi:hypothetical protein
MWPFSKKTPSLEDHLRGGRQVKIKGILFTIRKLNPADYLEGAKVMHEIYATYKTSEERKIDAKMVKSINKAKGFMRDIILAGVVKPALVRKPEDNPEAICVDEIFNDWELAQRLTAEIVSTTYGKKK